MPLTEQWYCIHGESVRLRTESPAIASTTGQLLAAFATRPSEAEPEPLEMALHSVTERGELPLAVSPSAVRLNVGNGARSEEDYALYRDGSRWILDFHDGGLLCLDPRAGRVEGWLVAPEARHPQLSVRFVRIALLELLRLRGVYAIHAAALEKDGRGFLIAGPRGHGKTTCCLALVRAGYRCFSDDHPLLRQAPAGLELLPFLSPVDVTERTIDFFPELRAAQADFRRGLEKWSFGLDEVFGPSKAKVCPPTFLILPRLVDWPESFLEPLPRARALEELLPEALLVLEPEVARCQFRTLAELVRTTACFRLHFGTDVLDLPAVFERLPKQADRVRPLFFSPPYEGGAGGVNGAAPRIPPPYPPFVRGGEEHAAAF